MFVDRVTLFVKGGDGGNGCCSFRREKFVPRGGPDGGDGGDGGSVILIASEHLNSLLPVSRRHHYEAEDGRPGMGQLCSGKGGADLEVEVPIGTQVYDRARGNLLRDLTRAGQRLVVAQ